MTKDRFSEEDIRFMRLAVDQSKRHWGLTNPNPSVGTVIVQKDKVLAIAVTGVGGRPHSEGLALQKLGKKAAGTTMYVTLEPCSHTGRTPACAETIVRHRIAKVFVGCLDPNPLVNGHGIAILKKAGIKVELGLLKEACAEVNEWFFKKFSSSLPYVIVKSATSWDGKIASHTGDSKWISCEESRRRSHYVRRTVDAIMVGKSTILADDPSLSIRHLDTVKNPDKVVLDRDGTLPHQLNIFQSLKGERVLYFSAKDKSYKFYGLPHIKTFTAKYTRAGFDMKDVLQTLKQNGVDSLLVEGGGNINASMFEQDLVDKVILFIAPKLIGGRSAPTFFEGKGADKISKALVLQDVSYEAIGTDLMMTGYLKRYS